MSKTYLCLLVILSAAFTGCSSPPHNLGEKYYLVVPNIKSPYWEQVNAGLAKAASDLSVYVNTIGPETYDPKQQKADFQRIASTKPAGLLVSGGDPKIMTDAINDAINAGIPVVTIDSDVPDSKRLLFVGTNNFEAGQMGARKAAEELKGKGNVVAFLTAGQANMEDRLHGYRSVFASYPQIKITQVVDLKGDPKVAFDNATELFDKTDAFISLEGQSAKEVAEVLTRKKAPKVVIAMDALPPTLEGIEKGLITATVAQKPFAMGYVGLRTLADIKLYKLPSMTHDFAKDPNSLLPRFVDTGFALLEKSTLAGYREASKANK
ncbi:MAG TPA: substrate-binding domain-containing protein [Bryobacteraceae bacterium]|nr:substrate-binding domain-containing protein [Bryobacteraceae bacterium]